MLRASLDQPACHRSLAFKASTGLLLGAVYVACFMVVNRPITRNPLPKPQDLVRSLTLFVSSSSISGLLETDPGRSHASGLGRAHRLEPKGPSASPRPSVFDVLRPSSDLRKLILLPKDAHTNSMHSLRGSSWRVNMGSRSALDRPK